MSYSLHNYITLYTNIKHIYSSILSDDEIFFYMNYKLFHLCGLNNTEYIYISNRLIDKSKKILLNYGLYNSRCLNYIKIKNNIITNDLKNIKDILNICDNRFIYFKSKGNSLSLISVQSTPSLSHKAIIADGSSNNPLT